MRARAILGAAAAAMVIAGCGGDDDGRSEEASNLLLATLTQDSPDIESANASLAIDGSLDGEQGGEFSVALGGPMRFGADGEPGALDWDIQASANTPLLQGLIGTEEVDFDGGITLDGEKLYVDYQGTAYEADEGLSAQIAPTLGGSLGPTATSGLEEEQAQQFIDAFSELDEVGTEEVGGEETTHLSGTLDAEGLQDLSGEGGPVQIDGVDNVEFDIWIADDEIARKVEVASSIEVPAEAQAFVPIESVDFTLTSEISDLNSADAIEPPANPKPIAGLLEELGVDPSALDALGGGGLPGLGGADSGETGQPGGAGQPGGDVGVPGGSANDPETQACIAEAQTPDAIIDCLNQ